MTIKEHPLYKHLVDRNLYITALCRDSSRVEIQVSQHLHRGSADDTREKCEQLWGKVGTFTGEPTNSYQVEYTDLILFSCTSNASSAI